MENLDTKNFSLSALLKNQLAGLSPGRLEIDRQRHLESAITELLAQWPDIPSLSSLSEFYGEFPSTVRRILSDPDEFGIHLEDVDRWVSRTDLVQSGFSLLVSEEDSVERESLDRLFFAPDE